MSERETEIHKQEEEENLPCFDANLAAAAPPSWTSLLNAAKNHYQDESCFSQVQAHFQHFSRQISLYGQAVKNEQDDPSSKNLTKALIVETRAALRFATVCLANPETRVALQDKAILEYHWHISLAFVLTLTKCDNKCRVLMARLLSNLVSSNPTSATAVAHSIPTSPSNEVIDERIRQSLTSVSIHHEICNDQSLENEHTPTWVDLMLACASCRDALAAIVAALYNCIVSIPPMEKFQGEPFAIRVTLDRLLVSTLLRQLLPATSVTAAAASLNDSNVDNNGDEATEWIVQTVEKLCQLGLLPQLYNSAAASGKNTVTPELIVLLHCVARAVHENADDTTSNKPLLGRHAGDTAIVSSHVFIANQFCLINTVLSSSNETNDESTIESFDPSLTREAWYLVLEILATSLGNDSDSSMTQTRLALGRDTALVPTVALDLGIVVDSLSASNQGRNARELVISNQEQRQITGLVQLIGNVCYRCRPNQDLVRATPVPGLSEGCHSCMDRTALHVLLSCTSLSYGCFTLREWAIVALRNVLEGNEANQALVQQLEAQEPMQSAELSSMGVRVDMDSDGKVRVVPTTKDTPPTNNDNVDDAVK
jgi:hypothetical protein